jgi:ribonuclease III
LDAPLVELTNRLGREFDDPNLLVQAVSHRSWCAEAGGHPSNERLEFLGDAVLGLVVADHCYRAYPSSTEGDMAQVRAAVVNTNVLAEVAAELGLGQAVRLGRGEEASGGRRKPSILADSFEALIGAIYLDGGWEPARAFVMEVLGPRVAVAAAGPGAEDHKTRLQEFVVHLHGQVPRYEVVGSGPDHDRRFSATVFVAGRRVGTGQGRSKKDAEQAAARAAAKTLADEAAAVRLDAVDDTEGALAADA